MSINFGTLGRKKQKVKAALNSSNIQTTESELDDFLKSIKAVPSEEEIDRFLREIKAIPDQNEINDFLIRIKAQDDDGQPMLFKEGEMGGMHSVTSSSVFAGESINMLKKTGTIRIKEEPKPRASPFVVVKN